MKLSFIIPVFNRPQETEELLHSLSLQSDQDFEVVLVEDGSTLSSEAVAEKYSDRLHINYYFKENSGPGPTRNFGCEKAGGDYLIFTDSDCIVPVDYVKTVRASLEHNYTDAFGGPDRAHKDFSNLQKAINFSMTSFLTTGGIRRGNEKKGKFYPRSFNMGISREVFVSTGGFPSVRLGEDPDLSIRILEMGFRTQYIGEAFVYHKRRTNLKQFFKQVNNWGIARIYLYKRHPGSLNLVYAAPALFVLGVLVLLLLSLLVSWLYLIPVVFHMLLLFLIASLKNSSIIIGLLAVVTSYTQMFGYGIGYMRAFWRGIILGKDEHAAFPKKFYR